MNAVTMRYNTHATLARLTLHGGLHAQYLGKHIINCLMDLAHPEHMILVCAHSSSLTLNGINSSSNVNNKLKRLTLLEYLLSMFYHLHIYSSCVCWCKHSGL